MRTLVDIPEQQLKDLAEICAARKISRAQGVRDAIAKFIEQNRVSRESAFGLWRDHRAGPCEEGALPTDGLAYQERLRGEW